MLMALPLFQRHPRYFVALGLAVLVTFFLFSQAFLSRSALFDLRLAGSTQSRIEDAERDYAISVNERDELIRQLGPDPALIEAWPQLGHRHHMYTLWDFFRATFRCPHKVRRVGALGDGGKWVCGLEQIAQQPSCVIYSVGINGESSFEAELLKSAPHCELWGYDYSVLEFGPEVEHDHTLLPRAHFHAYALGGVDSYGPGTKPPFYTLPTLMKINGHSFIDILKIDIEAFEFHVLVDVIKQFKGKPLPFGQLQIEIHAWNKSFKDVLHWWEALEEAGLRPFWTEPNLVYANLYRDKSPGLSEYSFINIKGAHALISDGPNRHPPSPSHH